MAIGKAASTGLKRGRKSKRGRPKKKVEETVEKKIKKKKKPTKTSKPPKLSKKWQKVLDKQLEEMLGTGSPKTRMGARGKTYLNDPTDVGEGPNTFPLSKHELPFDQISPARKRQLVETGQAMPTKKGRTKKNPSGLRKTGRFAEPQENVVEEMGLGEGVISEEELRSLGSFEIDLKKGGQIKYKKKGGPIGVGAARTGFGKVRR
tara:strand:- start:214 stop:828 length:615 start_codon:yes stop_codon:yes gene_type:complete